MYKGLQVARKSVDPELLKQVDFDSMTPEQLEAQMKEFAKMMKSGKDPMDMVREAREELEKNNKS